MGPLFDPGKVSKWEEWPRGDGMVKKPGRGNSGGLAHFVFKDF